MSNIEKLHQLLIEKKITVAVAESCTGGLLGAALTSTPGSSAYFQGGILSYSNEVKYRELKVFKKSLKEHGAVSEQVAQEMAQGVFKRFGVDVALSVTGIAGPGGGTDQKPVGLTYIGLCDAEGARAVRFIWNGDRDENRRSSVDAALEILLGWAVSKADQKSAIKP